jgi:hypothetical protein
LLLVFFMNQFTPAPEYSIRTLSIFSKIRGDIHKSRCRKMFFLPRRKKLLKAVENN